jgi:hypothetical protein
MASLLVILESDELLALSFSQPLSKSWAKLPEALNLTAVNVHINAKPICQIEMFSGNQTFSVTAASLFCCISIVFANAFCCWICWHWLFNYMQYASLINFTLWVEKCLKVYHATD